MLVDAINNRRPTGATETPSSARSTSTAPRSASMGLDNPRRQGETCLYEGRVIDLHGEPIEGAIVDVWSDNADGF